MENNQSPNYIGIFQDMILRNYPNKMDLFTRLSEKEALDSLEIIYYNEEISGNIKQKNREDNRKYKSYSFETIKQILNYQKKYKLTNLELANQFKLSRNTIASWKRKICGV